jgi:DNA-binding MarR family transcriptional regulator
MSRPSLSPRARRVETLTRQVRACFNRLGALADQLHRDVGVTGAMRSVMESLAEGGEQTVPTIARAKHVSRQHIQTLANALIERRLATSRPNQADARSPLIALTAEGQRLFTRMREREAAAFKQLTAALAGQDLDATLQTLTALRACLERTLEKGASP